MSDEKELGKSKFRAFLNLFGSIRTRYSLATAVFLLLILAMFYIGGRIVVVYTMRDTEQQVQNIGTSVSGFVTKDGIGIRNAIREAVRDFDIYDPQTTAQLITSSNKLKVSLAIHLNAQGQFAGGHIASPSGYAPLLVAADDLEPYEKAITLWARSNSGTNVVRSTGIMRLRGQYYHCAITRHGTQILVLGTQFDIDDFGRRMSKSLGQPVHITSAIQGDMPSVQLIKRPTKLHEQTYYGLTPMFTEQIHLSSGGFWNFEGTPLDAAFTIRDVANQPIAQISVSMPKSFSSVSSIALNRLTFCIALIGLLFIVPVFWWQCHSLLNPLTKMITRIREVSDRRKEVDCPRINWKGRDEFAQLASCVNTLLETISRRTVDVEQSAKRQRALIDGIPDGLVIFDSKCRLVYIFKQPEGVDPLPGLTERQELDPAVWGNRNTEVFNKLILRSFADHGRHVVILKIAALDTVGNTVTRNFDIRAMPMDAHFALVLFRDVSSEARENRRRFSELERDSNFRKQESLTALAAGIAHDVKNILSIVLNTTEITWQDQQTEQNRKAVATIRDAVRHGSDMMRELQTFAGETRMTLRPAAPTDLIRGAESLVRAIVGPRILIDFDVPYGLPPVDADPTQMWKVFFNIIKNAAESLGDNPGAIHVSATRYMMLEQVAETFESSNPLSAGPGIIFRITDNGPGIPADVLHRIFDPYISTKGTGRGLGLAIAYATVDAHGGGIRIRSIVGHGTTFEIFLPLSQRQITNWQPTASSNATTTDITSMKKDVLIVDDDPAVLRTTTVLLRFLKLSGHVAGDRHTALLKFRKLTSTLNCVLLDAHIASFSTVRVLEAMRMIAPHIPVILTSGSAEHEIANIFAGMKYDAFLAKPYTLDEFKAAIARINQPSDS